MSNFITLASEASERWFQRGGHKCPPKKQTLMLDIPMQVVKVLAVY